MSRIGKKPIPVPKGVTVSLKGQEIAVKGPKGELKRPVAPLVKVAVAGTEVTVTRDQNDGATRAQHGLMRALVQNMILGVTTGFERKLEINGVGYKAELKGQALVLSLADYAAKCGFFEAVLGLSGGIDSAITAALAAEALGSQKVLGVAMPGPYSSKGSLRDARELVCTVVEMTAARTPVAERIEVGLLLTADLLGETAARLEDAAGRKSTQVRQLALDHLEARLDRPRGARPVAPHRPAS